MENPNADAAYFTWGLGVLCSSRWAGHRSVEDGDYSVTVNFLGSHLQILRGTLLASDLAGLIRARTFLSDFVRVLLLLIQLHRSRWHAKSLANFFRHSLVTLANVVTC